MNNKIFSLIYTILPGFHRVILFFLAAKLMSIDSFANFSVYYSFASVISMIGAIGIGTLIIKDEISLSIYHYIKFICISILISTPVIILGCYYYYERSGDILSLLLLSFGLSANQVYRNEIILKKKFFHGSIYELSLLVLSLSFLVCNPNNIILILGIIFLTTSFAFKYIEKIENKNEIKNINIKQASFISYANLISSGILFFLPIMSATLASPNVTKIVSLLVSVIGVVSVFPRAFFNLSIKEIKNDLEVKNFIGYKKRIRRFRVLTSIIMLIASICVTIYMYIMTDDIPFKFVFIFIIIVSLFIYIGQFSIPETTMINMIGYEKFSFLMNAIVFSLFYLTYMLLNLFSVNDEFLSLYILCFSIVIGYLFRMIMVSNKIKRFLLL